MTSPATPPHAPPRWSLAFVGFYLSCAGVALGATFAGGGYMFFGSKGWLELRGDSDLVFRGLQGAPEKIALPTVDKEKLELEAFADAVVQKKPYMVPPEEAVNGVAVLEAIVASAAKGKPIKIQ